MTAYKNRWSVVVAWAVVMLIVWALFVPKGVSVGTFTLMTAGGVLMLVAGSALWRAQRPEPSIRQVRAANDARSEVK
jgi:nicotinamide riboside transporter PnuC